MTDVDSDDDAGDSLSFRLAARALTLGAGTAVTEKWKHGNVNMVTGNGHHSNIIVRICLSVLNNNTFIIMRFNKFSAFLVK